jgi:hypothetical protein
MPQVVLKFKDKDQSEAKREKIWAKGRQENIK